MVFKIALAGKIIEIHSVYKFVYYYCREYRTTEGRIDFIVETTMEEIDDEVKISQLLINEKDNKSQYIYGYTEFLIIYRKIARQMLFYSTLLFHGTVVSDGTVGFIIAAPSGTGKTTRARKLVKMVPDAFILNGDKPLIQIKNNKAIAYGTPWRGKEYIGKNASIPLSAIFLLQRSETTCFTEMPFEEALPELIKQTYFPESGDLIRVSMSLLSELSRIVRVYRYCSTSNSLDVIKAYEIAKIGIR